jgi:hypothetical protein
MHSFREYLYFLWKKSSEKQSRKKYNAHFHDDFDRFKKCTSKKSSGQINKEKKALFNYWGCFPYQYYRYDFYDRNCTLTIGEMQKYVPNFFMYNLFFPRSFMDYGIICENKGLTYPVFKGFGIPQPVMLLRYDDQCFFNEMNNAVNDTEADRILERSKAKKLFIKPSFGLGGQGIVIFQRGTDGKFADESGLPINSSYIRTNVKSGKYVIQEGLNQHEELSAIYPHSVNTFRIVTEYHDGKPWILYTLLRMGRGGKQVDNASAGGLYIKVDTEHGTLHDYAFSHNRNKFEVHPDTGFIFANARIQNWPVIKTFILKEIEKFREIRYLGWDVALTVDGPSVIELNNGPDVEILQDFYGGLKDDLHIIPAKWWYNHRFTLKELP